MVDNANMLLFYELVENTLKYSEQPIELCKYVTTQIRELIGVKAVVLLVYENDDFNILNIYPPRRNDLLDHEVVIQIIEKCKHEKNIVIINPSESESTLSNLFEKHNVNQTIYIPLLIASRPIGAILAYDLLSEVGNKAVIAALNNLAGVIALTLKNALSFQSMADIVNDRTKELRKKNEELEVNKNELQSQNEEYITLLEEYRAQNEKLQNTIELLDTSEKRYRRYIEFSPIPVFVANDEAKYTYVNNAACKMLGYTFNEITNMGILDIQKEAKDITNLEGFKQLSETGYLANFKTKLTRKDGKEVPVVLDAVKTSDKQFVAFCKDISIVEEAEQLKGEVKIAEKTAQIKQQLLANISHEMRTPMNGIIGMLDFLCDTNLDKMQEEYVKTIKESSESLLHIINDVLNLSKIEKGQLEIVKTNTNIYKLIEHTCRLFNGQAFQKGLKFKYETQKGLPENILADKHQLRQILFNLLSNALKYTNKGEVNLYLTYSKIKTNSFNCKITIEDTGIGIDSKNKDELFKPFTRVDHSYTRSTEGTGLGLSIVKKLVELMDGEIDFESKLGVGSKFWFTFNVEASAECEKDSNDIHAPDLKNLGLKILLAEDKIVNQKIAKLILENNGCSVDIANNGIEVLELFKENEFDIILMDIMMPEMDGIKATKELRRRYANLPPIIGISAHAMEGDAQRFIELGLNDYLEKPINKMKLLAKIQKWVQSYKPVKSIK